LESEVENKHGTGAFVLSGLSFIPLVGVIFGGICIINAIVSRKSNSIKLGLIGLAGIMFTVIIYGVLLPTIFKNSDFTKQFEVHAIDTMTTLVRNIEYFKLQNNRYPKSIKELRTNLKEGEMVLTFDMSGPIDLGKKAREFHYELINNEKNYLLFGVGVDAKPFTEDDIYPLIDTKKDKNIGWVKIK